MSIRKRGKSYYIEKMYKGKRYSMTVSHKPTKAEADRLIFELVNSKKDVADGAFLEFARKYIASKDNVLSPATIRGYQTVINQIPYGFKNKQLRAITQEDVQLLINELSGSVKPKTVRNISGFVSAVMRSVIPDWRSTATLPQKKVEPFYAPEKSDVKAILRYVKDTKYEIPYWLAVYGLRRSEIGALETSDLNNNTITVNKALVQDANKNWVVKSTKTTASTREIQVSDYVAGLIRELPEGPVYTGSLHTLNEHLHIIQDKLGIKRFRLHLLRHFFASTARGIAPDACVEYFGGWKPGSEIMKKVYDYAQKKELAEAMQRYINELSEMLA